MTKHQQLITRQFPDLNIKLDEPLAAHTYFKIGGPAEIFISLKHRDELTAVLSFCFQQQIPVVMLGGGSNVLVADLGIKGVVIAYQADMVKIVTVNPDRSAIIYADAGIKMSTLVRQVVDLGYQGLENFLGVPGTLGGAIYNNAHYLQSLLHTFVFRVLILDNHFQQQWLNSAECDFAYDQSRFQTTKEIILGAELHLQPGNQADSLVKIAQATQYRANTQPLGEPTSGCMFKNVPNTPELTQLFPQFAGKTHISAGFLIDRAGLKGMKVGDIEVSHKHAAFFINQGQGTMSDVMKLITLIKNQVQTKFNIQLETEVFILGETTHV